MTKNLPDAELIAILTRDGLSVVDHVLIGNESAGFSICIGHPQRGISSLIIEDDSELAALVAFLRRNGARQFDAICDFADSIGWDRVSRFDEA